MCSVKERGLTERRAVYLLLILWPLLAFVSSGYSQTENRGRIAFYSTRDGHHEIYVIDADGGNLRRLTFGDANNNCPAWSPDGKKIAFLSDRDGNDEIYVMNADGSNQTRLTFTPFPEHHVSWSPDGSRIVYKAHRPENKDIYVMSANGTTLVRLTDSPALDVTPDWAPNGKQIAFCTDRDGNREIYVMNTDGSNQQRLTNNTSLDIFPKWSPDGKQIIFLSHRGGDKDIYIMDADGGNEKKLTTQEGVDEGGCWSQDGKQIVFQTNRDGNYEIYVMNADGGNQQRVTNHSAGDYWPSWKAGATIDDTAVLTGPYLGQNPPGMTPEVFAPGIISGEAHFEHSSPCFSPDGRAVYWSVLSVHKGRRDEKIMFTELRDNGWTEPQIAPFNEAHHGGGPAFSPDGRLLCFYSARPFHRDEEGFIENIWAVELDRKEFAAPFKLDSVISSREHSERSPSFSSDGTIYFDRGQAGAIDIYRAKRTNGQYQEPEKLGAEINTDASEYAPCIAPDESFLIFSRFVDDASGKSVKLYVSFKREDGSWTKAKCLGDKLPLCNRARFPGLSPDGKYLFFCAHKDGRPDVYWVDARIIEELEADTPKRRKE
jgi:Tol biopolymer transport system component